MNKTSRGRALRLERLEARDLLSVSVAEFDAIRCAYPALNLPETCESLNVVEIQASNLSESSLREAIKVAQGTRSDDLIVLRTTDDANTITLEDKIRIDLDSSAYGALNVVAVGSQPLTIDAAQNSRVLHINGADVGLANLIITGGKTDYNTGGGIYLHSGSLTTSDVIISNNYSRAGGGVYVNTGTFEATNTTISGNSTNGLGAGVHVSEAGAFTAVDSTITENSASGSYNSGAGGVYVAGSFTAINTTISENQGGASGGVDVVGSFTATNSTISGNKATSSDGGGVYVDPLGTFTAINTTIAQNTARKNGGGVYVGATGKFTATNVALTDNEARNGGGVYADGKFMSTNSTIAGNVATSGGGVYVGLQGAFTSYNSIVVLNTANDVCSEGSTLGSNNLSTYSSWSGSDNHKYDEGAPLFRNAKMGDYRLIQNSQAIDKGSDQYAVASGMDRTWTDLAGEPRFVDSAIDIGAYEFFEVFGEVDEAVSNAPTDLTLGFYDVPNQTVELGWKDNSNDETGFQIEFSTDEGATWELLATVNADVSSYLVTNVRSNSKYIFRVCALWEDERTDWAYSETLHTFDSISWAPSDLTLGNYDASNRNLTVSWKDNSNDETGFRVEYTTDGGVTWKLSQVMQSNVVSRTAWGIQQNAFYQFRVCALRENVASEWAYSEIFETVVEKPQAPSDLTLGTYDTINRSVSISWKDNSNDETGFRVEYSTDGGQTWRLSQIMGADVTTRNAWGLRINALYQFRVCAVRGNDLSDWTYSEILDTTPQTDWAPSDLTLGEYDEASRSVVVNWKDNSSDETGFLVEYSTDGGQTWNYAQRMNANVTSRTAWGLKANATYNFRVCALRDGERSEWGYSPTLDTSVKTLAAPSDLTLGEYDVSKRSVSISWTDNSDDETGFRVEYSTDGGKTWKCSQVMDANVTSRNAWGLQTSLTYEFRVCAVRGNVLSDWAYSSSFTPGSSANRAQDVSSTDDDLVFTVVPRDEQETDGDAIFRDYDENETLASDSVLNFIPERSDASGVSELFAEPFEEDWLAIEF